MTDSKDKGNLEQHLKEKSLATGKTTKDVGATYPEVEVEIAVDDVIVDAETDDSAQDSANNEQKTESKPKEVYLHYEQGGLPDYDAKPKWKTTEKVICVKRHVILGLWWAPAPPQENRGNPKVPESLGNLAKTLLPLKSCRSVPPMPRTPRADRETRLTGTRPDARFLHHGATPSPRAPVVRVDGSRKLPLKITGGLLPSLLPPVGFRGGDSLGVPGKTCGKKNTQT